MVRRNGSSGVGEWTIKRELNKPPHPSEARLSGADPLRKWLTQLCREGTSNFYLTNEETGDELTVLMDRPYAAVSFMRSDAISFSASMNPGFPDEAEENCHDFDVGGTRTPVSMDRCLTFDLMTRIVDEVFRTSSRPSWIAWRQP